MRLFNLMGIHKLPITNHGSLQNPKQGSLKNHPSTKSGSLQNPKQGSLKCTLKKYPLKPLQNHKHESNAHCTATPKYPSTKSQTFGSCPYTLKKLYYKRLAFCRGNSWGCLLVLYLYYASVPITITTITVTTTTMALVVSHNHPLRLSDAQSSPCTASAVVSSVAADGSRDAI